MVESELPIPMPEIPGYVATGKKVGKATDSDLPTITAHWGPSAGTSRVRNRHLGGSSVASSSSGSAHGMNGPPGMAFSGAPPVVPLPPALNAGSSLSQVPSERSSGAGSAPSPPFNRQVPSVPPVSLAPPTPPPPPAQTSARPVMQPPGQFPPQPTWSAPPQRPPIAPQPQSPASPPAPAQFPPQPSMPPPVQIGTHPPLQAPVQLPQQPLLPPPAPAQGLRQRPPSQFPANLVNPSRQLTSRPLDVQSPPRTYPEMQAVKPQRGNGWLDTEVPKDGFGLLGEALLCPLKITVIILIEFIRSQRRKH